MSLAGSEQDLESPWGEEQLQDTTHSKDADWNKIENEFATAGYREGLSTGKESDALQQGFDEGFKDVGVPIGHQLGFLRGASSALTSFLSSTSSTSTEIQKQEIQEISHILSGLTFADIAPRDEKAEEHALHHLEEMKNEKWKETHDHALKHLEANDDIVAEKRVKDNLVEILERLSTVKGAQMLVGQKEESKAGLDDAEMRLKKMCQDLELDVNWS